MPGRFRPDELTDVQLAFLVGMTDERAANLWDAADFIADLKPEARDLLRNADSKTLRWLERASADDIDQLQYSIRFMNASKVLGRAAWIIGAALFGIALGVLTLWEKLATLFKAKT